MTTTAESTATPPDTPAKADLRRVKVYELQGDTWLDRGTGHCIGLFGGSEAPPQPGSSSKPAEPADSDPRLEVRQEPSEGSVGGQLLLRSHVLRPTLFSGEGWPRRAKRKAQSASASSASSSSSDEDEEDFEEDVPADEGDSDRSSRPRRPSKLSAPSWPEGGGIYQRQQATLVVWTEPDGTDMALSFATAQGCQDIWSFLCSVQNSLGPSPAALLDQATKNRNAHGAQNGNGRKDSAGWDDEDLADIAIQGPSGGPGPAGAPDDDDHPSFSMDMFPHHHLSSSSPSPPSTNLPEPSLSNIQEIEAMIKWACRSSFGRERVGSHILGRNYVKKLEQIKLEAEDLESLKDLHALCTLMQSILMLNDAAIYEYCLQDDIVLIVAGILDYDPEFGNQKASYYSDLSDPTRFKQVVPIKDPTIRAKIHQTYRLQYFKDIILARIIDDSTFSIINSMIFFNQIDIVQYLHSNEEFMSELFGIFDRQPEPEEPVIGPPLPPHMTLASAEVQEDDEEIIERKIDTILFIQQLSAMAKHLQPPSRIGFFRSLADRGVLKVIEFGLSKKPSSSSSPSSSSEKDEDPLDNAAIKSAICEILITIIDYDPHSVRNYCCKQYAGRIRNLVECLVELLLVEPDLGLKTQLFEALRILLDTGSGAGSTAGSSNNSSNTAGALGGFANAGDAAMSVRRDEDPDNERFLQFFYDGCVHLLVEPLLCLPEYNNVEHSPTTKVQTPMSHLTAARYAHLCDLFSFLIMHHSFRSKYLVLSSNLSSRLATLLKFDNYKFLQLSAIRFFRSCLNKHDEFYNRSLVKHELFTPILMVLERQLTNPKPVLNHLMDREGQRIRKLAEFNRTFKNLIVRWEQNNEPPPPPPPPLSSSTGIETGVQAVSGNVAIRNIGTWSRTRTLDTEEENYFSTQDSDDEDEDPVSVKVTSSSPSEDAISPNTIAIPTIPFVKSTISATDDQGLSRGGEGGGTGGRKRARSGALIDGSGNSSNSYRQGLSRSRTQSGPFLNNTCTITTTTTSSGTSSGLVDYQDEESEESGEEDMVEIEPPKRRKDDDDEDEDGAFARLQRQSTTASSSTAAAPTGSGSGSAPMIRSGFSLTLQSSSMTTTTTTTTKTTTTRQPALVGGVGCPKIVVSLGKGVSGVGEEKT